MSTPNTHSDARARVLAAFSERGEGQPRQVALNEIAELEHKIYLLEQNLDRAKRAVTDMLSAKRDAEALLNHEATRADESTRVLAEVESLLSAGRQAEVARRALAVIQREKPRLRSIA